MGLTTTTLDGIEGYLFTQHTTTTTESYVPQGQHALWLLKVDQYVEIDLLEQHEHVVAGINLNSKPTER